MKRALAVPTILIVGLIAAGCGSSSSKSNASNASAGTSSAASSTPASSGGYGPYSSGGSSSGGSAGAVTLTSKSNKLGTILAAGPKRLTVYLFSADKAGVSNCNSACAKVWTPVPASSTPTVSGAATQANVSTITRSDGSKQLAYNGHPLYYFVSDHDSGDAYGQGVHSFGSDWYVLAPSGRKIDKS